MTGLRRLARFLEQVVPRPRRPKRMLEQYRTPPELAARLVELCTRAAGKSCGTVIDLGAGTGMISYTAPLGYGLYSVGVEVDEEQLVLSLSAEPYRLSLVELVAADVQRLPLRPCRGCCVAMNPPFGVVRRGADTLFLRAAAALEPEAIASLHLASSGLGFLEKVYSSLGYRVVFAEEHRFPIPQMYWRHVKRIHYTRVLLLAARRVRE